MQYYTVDGKGSVHERKLYNDLLLKYNVLERPVENSSEPTNLSFGVTLFMINLVKSQKFSRNHKYMCVFLF